MDIGISGREYAAFLIGVVTGILICWLMLRNWHDSGPPPQKELLPPIPEGEVSPCTQRLP